MSVLATILRGESAEETRWPGLSRQGPAPDLQVNIPRMATTILRLTVTVPLMSHRHGFPAQSRVSGMLVFPVPGVPLCVALPLCLQASHAHFSLQGVSGRGAKPPPLPRGESPVVPTCTHSHTGHTGSGWVKLTPPSGLQSPLVILPESLCFSSSQ